MVSEKVKAYSISIGIALLIILGIPLAYYALHRGISELELKIGLCFSVPMGVAVFIYLVLYPRIKHGPEWYKVEFRKAVDYEIPRDVARKARRIKLIGLLVLFLGVSFGIIVQMIELAALFALVGLTIVFQGQRKEAKYLSEEARKEYERIYGDRLRKMWLIHILARLIILVAGVIIALLTLWQIQAFMRMLA
ncbi:MAG: hypothetical protein JTT17_00870 [Candidatus Brockarchaeota archaeon]|nr:hypothetical protein [Candidatus Brockarchaeota archaeon]